MNIQSIDGKTKIYGVIADPIQHVKAPELLNSFWKEKNSNNVMIPIHVSSDNLEKAIQGLKLIPNFLGFCVTIPHKVKIASLCDKLLPMGQKTGAVNAVVFNSKRELVGNNFDGKGFVDGLKERGHSLLEKNIFIAGAGGAARGIALALAEEKIKSITLSNRTEKNTLLLSQLIKKWYPDLPVVISSDPQNNDILINATSLGLNDKDKLPFPLVNILNKTIVADIIMDPENTKLLIEAKKNNLKIHYGKHMLEYQLILIEKFLTQGNF